ncbi:hypothetical protein [Oceanibium sediminis]|uniref:hypothetical protein n=1 Tax=Oceanibium sediminis TaxID=2026339 RepID=UPI000DD32960|nr:hypothetical protein [Oceanibium sediminis]
MAVHRIAIGWPDLPRVGLFPPGQRSCACRGQSATRLQAAASHVEIAGNDPVARALLTTLGFNFHEQDAA